MISIEAKNEGKQTELKMSIKGSGEDILNEAVHIMEQLPKQIKDMSKPIYLRMLANLLDSLGAELMTGDEKDEDNDD